MVQKVRTKKTDRKKLHVKTFQAEKGNVLNLTPYKLRFIKNKSNILIRSVLMLYYESHLISTPHM